MSKTVKKDRKKMSKVSVDDLNFDDISGKTTVEAVGPAVTPPKEEQPKEVKSSENDYQLAIRLSAGEFKLISLETCTSTEFFECMGQLYPYMGETEPEKAFPDRQSRIRTLKHVLNFHSEVFKPMKNFSLIEKKSQQKVKIS